MDAYEDRYWQQQIGLLEEIATNVKLLRDRLPEPLTITGGCGGLTVSIIGSGGDGKAEPAAPTVQAVSDEEVEAAMRAYWELTGVVSPNDRMRAALTQFIEGRISHD